MEGMPEMENPRKYCGLMLLLRAGMVDDGKCNIKLNSTTSDKPANETTSTFVRLYPVACALEYSSVCKLRAEIFAFAAFTTRF